MRFKVFRNVGSYLSVKTRSSDKGEPLGGRSCHSRRKYSSTIIEQFRVKFLDDLDRSMVFQLDHFASKTPTPLSLQNLMNLTKNPIQKDLYTLMIQELPVRLANMILELQILPKVLSMQPTLREILFEYVQSFKDIILLANDEPNNKNEKIVELLKDLRIRHLYTVPKMASAVQSMLENENEEKMNQESVQYCLDRLYINRISIHLLISVYLSIYSSSETKNKSIKLKNVLDPRCDVLSIAVDAFDDAAYMCDREFLEHPDLELLGKDATSKDLIGELRMCYAPNHLHHIFFEIFKNAMRASVEEYKRKNLPNIPTIKCLVSKSVEDVSIRVSDQGGGICREKVDKTCMYSYTTASAIAKERNTLLPGSGGLESQVHPMHGLGYGLPLSKVYARYFGGDLNLYSMHGVGTDVFVHLKANPNNAIECLPRFSVKATKKLHGISVKKVPDWTS